MFWAVVGGIIVGGLGLVWILRNWDTAAAIGKLLFLLLATFAILAAFIGIILLAVSLIRAT
jgi:hypothetical protein